MNIQNITYIKSLNNYQKPEKNSYMPKINPSDKISVSFGTSTLVTDKETKTLVIGQNLGISKAISVDHETYFHRHPGTISFINNHVSNNCPDGCYIINIFSSVGEEAKTTGMFLGNKLLKMLCIDISPEIVEVAKEGIHLIKRNPYIYKYGDESDTVIITPPDGFLLQPDHELTDSQLAAKNVFFKHFDLIKQDSNKIKVKSKKEAFNNIEFIQGDALEIGNIKLDEHFDNKKAHVVIAQNGSYHILGNNKTVIEGQLRLSSAENCNFSDFRKLIEGIHKILDKDGILVYGSLDRDHLTQEDLNKFSDPKLLRDLKYNDNKYISSLIHDIIKQTGFEPIYFSKINSPTKSINSKGIEFTCHLPKLNILVPTIFRKI
jgi:SAM-dependent methyltransferase